MISGWVRVVSGDFGYFHVLSITILHLRCSVRGLETHVCHNGGWVLAKTVSRILGKDGKAADVKMTSCQNIMLFLYCGQQMVCSTIGT